MKVQSLRVNPRIHQQEVSDPTLLLFPVLKLSQHPGLLRAGVISLCCRGLLTAAVVSAACVRGERSPQQRLSIKAGQLTCDLIYMDGYQLNKHTFRSYYYELQL